MYRWSVVLVVLASLLACALPAAAVDLVQGWQMVSFSIREAKPLDDFDVINQTTSERQTFAEASAPGGWVDNQLWAYDTATHGYVTVGLGQQVEPDRGYWFYVYSSDPLTMVPTYNISDFLPLNVGYSDLLEEISNGTQGTHWVNYQISEQVDTCGLLTSRLCASFMPLGGGDVFDWRCNRFAFDGQYLMMAAQEEMDSPTIYMIPPIQIPARVYPGETVIQQITAGGVCDDPSAVPVTFMLRMLGTEWVNTAQGDLLCIKLEITMEFPDQMPTRSVEWYAPGIGRVRSIDWYQGHLDAIQDLPGPG
jgi:hypothetical protein